MKFILSKLLSMGAVLLIVAFLVFVMIRFSPGDPAAILAGDNATAQQIQSIRESLRLDDPLPLQFGHWFSRVVTGDFGTSIFSGEPVLDMILKRVGPTLSLTLLTMGFAIIVAVILGVIAAARAGWPTDRLVMIFSVVGFSVPGFVTAYLLIYVLSVRLGWFPVQGYTPLSEGVGPWLHALILPALVLSLTYIALIARITRATMLEVLSEDYIRTARAKGVAPNTVLYGHALQNAGVPIVTIIGLGFSMLIGGVVITETVFNIPGIGRLVIDAITKRDYPIIQGITLMLSAVYVLVNLMVDLSYGLIDPRTRKS
ncbi:ABC transporter permease [Marinovum sp. 2_MG-2023]|uniref:ABC transporter permease n=1 Tax=unclassified Marinovum TaxID=2647166 RepID=UPI0026E22D57|nr:MULTISPECIES: ABC transporter permease [unclassified Marinovum]MDO6732576.1 ABC transporter permease [Marinovum sp. 2_MG-2023]MDO6782057.1 ABC transporter permease [Marinovum sp. 1_MG-2023]